jgi:polar amino acid transport system substrate-binding protein
MLNIPKLKVAVLKGSTSQIFAEKTLQKTDLLAVKSLNEAVNLLLEDKVAVVVADHPFCAVTAYRYKEQGVKIGNGRFTFEPLGIALPPGDLLTVNWVDNFLKIMKESNELDAIQNRWFKDAIWIEELL